METTKEKVVAMEASQALSIESFSYRWLINLNLKPSFDGCDGSFRASLEASDEGAFIVLDPKMLSSKFSFEVVDAQDFNFPTTTTTQSSSPPILVHADEVFSNGLLMPYYLSTPPKVVDALESSLEAVPASPLYEESFRFVEESNQRKCSRRVMLKKVWKLWKRIITKRLVFLRPFSQKIQDSSYGSTVSFGARSTGDETIDECKRIVKSEGTSPRTSVGYSNADWSAIERSIQDAVLHCKMSFEK